MSAPSLQLNGSVPDSETFPLVSCIMPTFDRRRFILLALQNFLRQDYPNKELLVIDDGTDAVGDLVQGFPQVHYRRLPHRWSIGAKRNFACQHARGEIIAHWDDDDWYAPERLRHQAAPIVSRETDITGLENHFVMTLPGAEFWTTNQQLHQRMFACDVHGGTLVYRRALFQEGLRYPEVDLAEDAAFLTDAIRRGWRLQRLPNPGVFIYVRHLRNAWKFEPGQFLDPAGWTRIAPPPGLPGDVLECYRATSEAGLTAPHSWPNGASVVYLDTLPQAHAEVGCGGLGTWGELGYGGRMVKVQGRPYLHALSTHAPAKVTVRLDGRFRRFVASVAFNDDVPAGASHADFCVLADGRLVGLVSRFVAGSPPRILEAEVTGAREITLLVLTGDSHRCQAVWLDPFVDGQPPSASIGSVVDCFGRVSVEKPVPPPTAERCAVTIVSPGYTNLLDDMLGSFIANAGCPDALIVVFAVDADEHCLRVAAKYGAFVIRCTSGAGHGMALKSVIYAAPHLIDARKFLFLDADVLVLGNLSPVFASLDALPDGSILACREGHDHTLTLGRALTRICSGAAADLKRILGTTAAQEGRYRLVVNSGVFAGTRGAILRIDGTIRGWPEAAPWLEERADVPWREQFIFNLALAHHQCGVELDLAYNIQLHVFDPEMREEAGRIAADWQGRPVKVLHYSGGGRQKHLEWRRAYSCRPDPMVNDGGQDDYAAFQTALRTWVGRHGLGGLIWSFYGTTDGRTARVQDTTTLPLFALLHYLIRANGCVKVLETGTARGVSAACLASAVAGRPNARVVTFDPHDYDGRNDLWTALPVHIGACIEQRPLDSLTGMTAALNAGESYEAALLDSLHSEEHVWAEFQLATKLVCPGGLILIHDARFSGGEIPKALARILSAGYPPVRLWCAQTGYAQDDQLGLALIENTAGS